MTVVLQQGINGVVLGSLYVLVALGLTLIYGVLVQINFAHADIVTLGAFSAYFFMHSIHDRPRNTHFTYDIIFADVGHRIDLGAKTRFR